MAWRTGSMDVYTAGDWIWLAGTPGSPFTVTVVGKAEMHGVINRRAYQDGSEPGSITWAPSQPDVAPGDTIIFEVDGYTKRIDPILDVIVRRVDPAKDTVAGVIEGQRDRVARVVCEVGPQTGEIAATWDPVTGAFACDFSAVSFDFKRSTDVDIRYYDRDGDCVTTTHLGRWARANVTWNAVGGWYGPDVTMAFTATSSTGSLKAAGSATTRPDGWVDDVWVDADLVQGDQVHVTTNDGFDAWMTLPGFDGLIDVERDRITGKVRPVTAIVRVGRYTAVLESDLRQGRAIRACIESKGDLCRS